MLKVPVRAQGSTLVGNTSHIVTSRMTRKIIGRQATLPLSLASLGVSFLIEGGVAVADVEGTIPVISPDRPVNSHINDNYCLVDPQLKFVEDPMCQDLNKPVIKTVNLNVVCHAPCVTVLSENKDIRPNQAQMEIKCVKPVCCVNHPRFKSAELLPSNLIFQDGDTRDHPTLPSKRGVGDVSGFQ